MKELCMLEVFMKEEKKIAWVHVATPGSVTWMMKWVDDMAYRCGKMIVQCDMVYNGAMNV